MKNFNNNSINLFSKDEVVSKSLEKMKQNGKIYAKFLTALRMLGSFAKTVEVFIEQTQSDIEKQHIKLWCFDNKEDMFVFCSESEDRRDLSIVEKYSDSTEDKKYDLSLAKDFELSLDNIEYLRTAKEYNFKFGRLITDSHSFCSLFLGNNIGFQVDFNSMSKQKNINDEDLIRLLNSIDVKPNLQVFLGVLTQAFQNSGIEVGKARIVAFNDLKSIGDFVIDNTPQNIVEPTTFKRSITNDDKKEESKVTQRISEQAVAIAEITDDKSMQSASSMPVMKVGGDNMIKKEKQYLMDQEHYNTLSAEIESLKQKRNQINMGRNEAFDSSAGDGWDSPEFEELEREERMVLGHIEDKMRMLRNAVIVESQNREDIIDIGDVVRVNVDFGDDDIEESIYKLTGGATGDIDGLTHISINSPLGASIYQKRVGDDSSYQVESNTFKVKILEKMLGLDQEAKKTR